MESIPLNHSSDCPSSTNPFAKMQSRSHVSVAECISSCRLSVSCSEGLLGTSQVATISRPHQSESNGCRQAHHSMQVISLLLTTIPSEASPPYPFLVSVASSGGGPKHAVLRLLKMMVFFCFRYMCLPI